MAARETKRSDNSLTKSATGIGKSAEIFGLSGLNDEYQDERDEAMEYRDYLEVFSSESFCAEKFIESVTTEFAKCRNLDFSKPSSLGPLQDHFDQIQVKLEDLNKAAILQMAEIKEHGSSEFAALANVVRDQAAAHENVFKKIESLERPFQKALAVTINISSRIGESEKHLTRATRACSLLKHFEEISQGSGDFMDTVPGSSDKTSTASIIKDLKEIVSGLNAEEEDFTRSKNGEVLKNLNDLSDQIMKKIQSDFDKANKEGDLDKMIACADVVLNTFDDKNEANTLISRFVAHRLAPMTSATGAAHNERVHSPKESLRHRLSLMKSLLRSTNFIAFRVFPDHIHQVLSVFISKLFFDPVFWFEGNFREYHLSSDAEPFTLRGVRNSFLSSGMKLQEGKGAAHHVDRANRALPETGNNADIDNHSLVKALQFDPNVVRLTMKMIFRSFLPGYFKSEISGFKDKTSKRASEIFPASALQVCCPSFLILSAQATQENVSEPSKDENDQLTRDYQFWRSKKGSKKSQKAKQDNDDKVNEKYFASPIQALADKLKSQTDLNIKSLMYQILQLSSSWHEDLFQFSLKDLHSLVSTQPRWSIGMKSREQITPTKTQKVHTKCGFENLELRGLPGAILRWAHDAHERCASFLQTDLGEEEDLAPGSLGFLNPHSFSGVKFQEDDGELVRNLSDLFELFCKAFFSAALVPCVATLSSQLPLHAAIVKEDANPSSLKPLVSASLMRNPSSKASFIVVGEDEALDIMGPKATYFPALASRNTAVKSLVSRIAKLSETRSNFGGALIPSDTPLFIASLHAIEDCVDHAAFFWRECVYPVVSNWSSCLYLCQEALNVGLGLLEDVLQMSLKQQLQNACITLQACLISFRKDSDYNPRDDESEIMRVTQPSDWASLLAQTLDSFLDVFARLSNAEARSRTLLVLNYFVRDIFMANLRISKVSPQGSLRFAQDISLFSRTILGNEFCANDKLIKETWDHMNCLSQLYVVKLSGLEAVLENNFWDIGSRYFVLECLSRRTDINLTASWVRSAFPST